MSKNKTFHNLQTEQKIPNIDPIFVNALKKTFKSNDIQTYINYIKNSLFFKFIQQQFKNCNNVQKANVILLQNMIYECFEKDEKIYKKGNSSNNKIYFILSGSVNIVQMTKKDFLKQSKLHDYNHFNNQNQQQEIIQIPEDKLAQAGNYFGQEVITQKNYIQRIDEAICIEKTQVATIRKKNFMEILEQFDSEILQMRQIFEKNFKIFQSQEVFFDVQKFIYLLEKQIFQINQFITQKTDIGKYIYFMINGSCQVMTNQENQKMKTNVCKIDGTNMIGDEILFKNDHTYDFNVQVQSYEVLTYRISIENFQSFFDIKMMEKFKQYYLQKNEFRMIQIEQIYTPCKIQENQQKQSLITGYPKMIQSKSQNFCENISLKIQSGEQIIDTLNNKKQKWNKNSFKSKNGFPNDLGMVTQNWMYDRLLKIAIQKKINGYSLAPEIKIPKPEIKSKLEIIKNQFSQNKNEFINKNFSERCASPKLKFIESVDQEFFTKFDKNGNNNFSQTTRDKKFLKTNDEQNIFQKKSIKTFQKNDEQQIQKQIIKQKYKNDQLIIRQLSRCNFQEKKNILFDSCYKHR